MSAPGSRLAPSGPLTEDEAQLDDDLESRRAERIEALRRYHESNAWGR